MREVKSDYGRVIVGSKPELFQQALDLGLTARAKTERSRFLWALTGGGTPKEWYQWLVADKKITPEQAGSIEWTVSDERHVLLSSGESNFGNAERQLLAPLDVPTDRRHPWMVAWPVAEAAEAYRRTMLILAGPGRAYDVCFLGMGDTNNPVNIWMWKAGWQQAMDGARPDVDTVHPSLHVDKYFETRALFRTAEAAGNLQASPELKSPVEDANARGFGSFKTQPVSGQNVGGKGIWRDGFWSVLVTRQLNSREAEDVKFAAGKSVPVAFAVWNGQQRDRNGRKVISNWYQLLLDP